MNTPAITFHDALMRERARMQIDRRTVADRCGVGENVVKRWERGEAIPSRQQFKRLVTMLRRVAPHIPEWGTFADEIVTGEDAPEREEYQGHARRENERLDKIGADLRPPPESFGAGLRRVREENEVTQDELGEVLGLTGGAVGYWERDNAMPIQVNLDKLYTVLPELKAGVETGAIKRPVSKDMEMPGPVPGAPRASSVDTMLEMAIEQSEAERERPVEIIRCPTYTDHRWQVADLGSNSPATGRRQCSICGAIAAAPPPVTLPRLPRSINETITKIVRGRNHGDSIRCPCGGGRDLVPEGDHWICPACRRVFVEQSTVTELAEAYGRARLLAHQAAAEEKRTHAVLCDANDAHTRSINETIASRKEAEAALELLDLAISEDS